MSTPANRGQSPISYSGSDPDFRFARAALRMSSPVIVWALHFTVVYGFTALACARGFGGGTPWAVGVATGVAAVLCLLIIVSNLGSGFTRWVSACLAGASLVAIAWEGLSAFMVPNPCA
jgi:hypothetical protein